MALTLIHSCLKILFLLWYIDTIHACHHAKHHPNIPYMKKMVWKGYQNQSLEVKVFNNIEKEKMVPVNLTLEIDSEMKFSQSNISEAPIRFSIQLLQKMPRYHLSSPQFSGSLLRKTKSHILRMVMEMDFEINDQLHLLTYCTRLTSSRFCVARHTMTIGLKKDSQISFLSFFVSLDFELKNILLCIATEGFKNVLHCYNHLNGIPGVEFSHLSGDVLLKLNRSEACIKRMKFNSISYINHQLTFKDQNPSKAYSEDDSNVIAFVSKSQQVATDFKFGESHGFHQSSCINGSQFCEFSESHCIDKNEQCQNLERNIYTWNMLHGSNIIEMDQFDVHKTRNISISFSSPEGSISFITMSGETLDRVKINRIFDNSTNNSFSVKYGAQKSLFTSSSSTNPNERRLVNILWIYIEFPENVNDMCLLKENAKLYVFTTSEMSFLGYMAINPRYWYAIKMKGAVQMRMAIQRDVELPAPVLFPVYSSIPVYSRTAGNSNLEISNVSFENCRRIRWKQEESRYKIALSVAVPITLILIFMFLFALFLYKIVKQRCLNNGAICFAKVSSKKVSQEFGNTTDNVDMTEESIYYSKRRNMNYKAQIEHTNVKRFITMEV